MVRIQLNVLIFTFIVFNVDHFTPEKEGKTKDNVTNSQIYRKKKKKPSQHLSKMKTGNGAGHERSRTTGHIRV